MDAHLQALRNSAARLATIVSPLSDDLLVGPSYASEWSIADVVSHLGSGGVIMLHNLDGVLAGKPTDPEFAQSVWDEWNSKSPRAQVDEGLVADSELIARLSSLTDEERSRFRFAMGPIDSDITLFVSLRLNEHAMHTWDIEIALDPAATLAPDAAALVVDNLELIARFTAKPIGVERVVTVGVVDPTRWFTIVLSPDAVTFSPSEAVASPDITIPAEAFSRLVYGRLDSEHTPTISGDAGVLDELRRVFPGV